MEVELKKELERALSEREEYRRQIGQLDENCPPPPPMQQQWRLLNLEIAILMALQLQSS